MKFSATLKNNYNDLNISFQRKKLLESAKSQIENLKEEMFDVFKIENIYLLESFYNNDVPFIEKVPVFFRMNYSDFCSLVDSKYIDYSLLEIFIETNNEIYSLNKDKLKLLREEFHYDKIYKL